MPKSTSAWVLWLFLSWITLQSPAIPGSAANVVVIHADAHDLPYDRIEPALVANGHVVTRAPAVDRLCDGTGLTPGTYAPVIHLVRFASDPIHPGAVAALEAHVAVGGGYLTDVESNKRAPLSDGREPLHPMMASRVPLNPIRSDGRFIDVRAQGGLQSRARSKMLGSSSLEVSGPHGRIGWLRCV